MIYTTDEIRQMIIPVAKKYELSAVYLFGSYARTQASENSDIDILIDRSNSKIKGLLDMGALYNDLSECFTKNIDVVTIQSLEQSVNKRRCGSFGENLKRERVKIYER